MIKLPGRKLMALILGGSIVINSASFLTGCGSDKNEPVTLTVYSQLANYSGMQTGWGADVLLDKFNVKLNFVQNSDGTYQTRAETGDLGDIVIFGNSSDTYPQAVKDGLLYDWNDDDLLAEYGSYINDNMTDALNKNKELTSTITDGESDTLYGFGNDVATSSKDHKAFFYSWDLRWDLYKQLGYPEINDMDDLEQVLIDMQKLCPKDDSGNKTYAVSLWPDWDDAMVMYVKATATAYYGYDELGLGLYDPTNGVYHDALEENGPYLQMLKFYNKLYQDGLVDPDSMTQTCNQMGEKVTNGGVLFSIFNYSGSLLFNTDEHTESGKMMYSLKPSESSPIVYGMNTQGGDKVWTIGANSKYPELAMEVINFMSTPEGCLDFYYGPKGETWDYDEDGNTYFTELGKKCHSDKSTKMGDNHEGAYEDGNIQFNASTWAQDASNPESNGETYNSDNWKSNLDEECTDIMQDWKDYTGCTNINDYMETGNFTVAPGTSYEASSKSDELKTTWSQVTNCIKTYSWNAIYAKTDAEYDKIVAQMLKKSNEYGYADCLKWSQDEAATRKGLEDALTE